MLVRRLRSWLIHSLALAGLLTIGVPPIVAWAATPAPRRLAGAPPDHPIEHRPGGLAGVPNGYIPCDVYDAYHLNGTGLDGSGVTIAIIDWYLQPTIRSDLQAFDQTFGLPAPPAFDIVFPYGQPAQIDTTDETALDVE